MFYTNNIIYKNTNGKSLSYDEISEMNNGEDVYLDKDNYKIISKKDLDKVLNNENYKNLRYIVKNQVTTNITQLYLLDIKKFDGKYIVNLTYMGANINCLKDVSFSNKNIMKNVIKENIL